MIASYFNDRRGSNTVTRFDDDSFGGYRDGRNTLMVACTNYTIEKEDLYMR